MAQTEVFKETIIRSLFKGAHSSCIHSLYFSIAISALYHTIVSNGNSELQVGGAVNKKWVHSKIEIGLLCRLRM